MEQHNSFSVGLAKKLSNGTRRWVLGVDGPRHQASYFKMLHREIGSDLHSYLTGEFASRLKARGIVPLSSEKAAIIVRGVLSNTNDLRRRLLTAPDRDGIVAGAFDLGVLVDEDHQQDIGDSLVAQAEDDYEQQSFEAMLPDSNSTGLSVDDPGYVGFTGDVMWVVNSDNSRHPELDGLIIGPDETFPIGDGWRQPREDPADAANSSGCQCSLAYEYQDEEGGLSWV